MGLSDAEREELRSAARSLLGRRSGTEAVRETVESPAGYDESLWKKLGELGWLAIHVPEERGGAGASYEDLAVVVHELGRRIVPSPITGALLAMEALLAAADRPAAGRYLPGLLEGSERGAVALTGGDGSYDGADTPVLDGRAGSATLHGRTRFVLDAAGADLIVVRARTPRGDPVVVAVEGDHRGISMERVPTLDRTRRLFEVRFDDVMLGEDDVLAEPGPAGRPVIDRVLALGTALAVGDAVGVADTATEMTAEYAKSRHQFGRPIGSFQAVKHHCADMLIALETSRAAALAAFRSLDSPRADARDDPVVAAAAAASYAGPACAFVAARAVDVHGGIGFTWEHDCHLLLKRAKLDEVLFGRPAEHRRRLARRVFPAVSPAWTAEHFAG